MGALWIGFRDALQFRWLWDRGWWQRKHPSKDEILEAVRAGRMCICGAENVTGPCPMHPTPASEVQS